MQVLKRYDVIGFVDNKDVSLTEFCDANDALIRSRTTPEEFTNALRYFACGFSTAIYKGNSCRQEMLTKNLQGNGDVLTFIFQMDCDLAVSMEVNKDIPPYIFRVLSCYAEQLI